MITKSEMKETALVRRMVYHYADVLKIGDVICIKEAKELLSAFSKRPRKQHVPSPLGINHSWKYGNLRSYTR